MRLRFRGILPRLVLVFSLVVAYAIMFPAGVWSQGKTTEDLKRELTEELREELTQELTEELKQELTEELRRELREEIKKDLTRELTEELVEEQREGKEPEADTGKSDAKASEPGFSPLGEGGERTGGSFFAGLLTGVGVAAVGVGIGVLVRRRPLSGGKGTDEGAT
ncbi:MAG: hypothetical protein IMX03_08075 [Brockia lithotrophica]|nr:hypothetical protein [Brockia lithotrophica]